MIDHGRPHLELSGPHELVVAPPDVRPAPLAVAGEQLEGGHGGQLQGDQRTGSLAESSQEEEVPSPRSADKGNNICFQLIARKI